MADIYGAAKLRGKYPPLSPTLRCIIVLVYITQVEYLADQNITFGTQSDVRSHFVSLRLLGGEKCFANHLRVNQSARAESTIHLCGIY